jgi:hypothetical protein
MCHDGCDPSRSILGMVQQNRFYELKASNLTNFYKAQEKIE